MPRRVSVFGSTGSIGCSTFDVIRHANEVSDEPKFDVYALAAGQNVRRLAEQAVALNAELAVISDEAKLEELQYLLKGTPIRCAAGSAAVSEAASTKVDMVMASIVGAVGLEPLLVAIDAGSNIALANKEAMVCAGPLVRARAAAAGIQIVPVDSEHNAIFQVLEARAQIERVVLTASGGPFLDASLSEMKQASVDQALAHPRWSMGPKNSLDSATMMNKGLELIEAAYLFDLPPGSIDVVVHPQSIVHSLVGYVDGSFLAQLSEPDMKVPIAHALSWPDRIPTSSKRLNLIDAAALTFRSLDPQRFPAVDLARQAVTEGPDFTTAFNGANEVAGEAFLSGRIGFLDISHVVAKTLDNFADRRNASTGDVRETLEAVQLVDSLARVIATETVQTIQNPS